MAKIKEVTEQEFNENTRLANEASTLADEATINARSESENGIKLRFSGEIARVKRGKGKEFLAIKRLHGGDPEKIEFATMCVLMDFDGKKKTIEEIEDMDCFDLQTMLGMIASFLV